MPDFSTYNWRELSPATSPPARYGHAMVWAGDRIIMFGGTNEIGVQAFDDTWQFFGGTWTDLSPATTPTARARHQMVWDGTRVLMFGGIGIGATWDDVWAPSQETWELLVGGDWNLLSPAAVPTLGRRDHDMVWDGSRVLLYGGMRRFGVGSPGAGIITKQTWKYEAANWSQIATAAAPVDVEHSGSPIAAEDGRAGMRMIWDGSQVVLFGGYSDAGGGGEYPASPFPYYETGGGTWVFPGANWSQPGPPTDPFMRHTQAICVTDDDQKILMFGGNTSKVGGFGNFFTDQTLQNDGSDWSEITRDTHPSQRDGVRLVWDTVEARGLLFGGARHGFAGGDEFFADTWEFAPEPSGDFYTILHTFGLND